MRSFVRSTTVLQGDVDLEKYVLSVPDSFLVKGMFFRRAISILGDDLSGHQGELREPTDHYTAFHSYPQRDHALLSHYAAIAARPQLSEREALRQYAKDDIHDFADSMLGKVMMSMVGDPIKALGLVPSVYNKVAPGPWKFERRDEGGDFVLRFGHMTGDWAYQVGQFEGIVEFYGATATFEIDDDYPCITFRVRFP